MILPSWILPMWLCFLEILFGVAFIYSRIYDGIIRGHGRARSAKSLDQNVAAPFPSPLTIFPPPPTPTKSLPPGDALAASKTG